MTSEPEKKIGFHREMSLKHGLRDPIPQAIHVTRPFEVLGFQSLGRMEPFLSGMRLNLRRFSIENTLGSCL